MSLQKISITFLLMYLFAASPARAVDFALDLPAALDYALRENTNLKTKRHSLEIAQGRAVQAGLLFQNNPRFSVEVESQASEGNDTIVELNLLQELEIAGQRSHRSEAAEKNLAQIRLSIENAERVVRLEVTRAFYDLLASQQAIADLNEVLAAQVNLLEAAQNRFQREDISILEFNTLRLDRDQVRNELEMNMLDHVSMEKQLRLFIGLREEGSLRVTGNLLDLWNKRSAIIPDRQHLQECALESRPDLKAAKVAVDVREAELRLAQARRIPNVSIGPRYKREFDEHLFGGEISIPLPLFNRNQEEVATAHANRKVSKAELEGRLLLVREEIDSAYSKLALAKERMEVYDRSYLGELNKTLGLAQRAYENGEMTIFEYSITRDRFTQARARSVNAALASLQALAELSAQAPGCLN